MSALLLLLSLAAVDLLSIASPGPNILLVTQTAVERGRRQALCVTVGIMAASLTWASLALLGLTALFEVLPSLQTALRIAGAAFLIYLGVRLWRSAATSQPIPDVSTGRVATRSALRGFATGILNPKSLTYFGTIFVLFVPADAPLETRLAALAVVALDGFLVYGVAAVLFSTDGVKASYLALRRPIDRVCAAVMTVLGARLISL
jgi:threonine/homoserine/homoserine lactone efflux protein